MSASTPNREFSRRSDRIEELVSRLEHSGDPALRAVAQELLESVLELHGIALERILNTVAGLPKADTVMRQLAEDDLVSGVLSLHSLHPVPLELRVASALDKARPYVESHGGHIELAFIDGGAVHLRLKGTCGTCASSTQTMRDHIESAIYDAAPEVLTVIADVPAPAPTDDLVQVQTA